MKVDLVDVPLLLELRSSEAELLRCSVGHIAGYPKVCLGGCRRLDGGTTVSDAIPLLDPGVVAAWRRRLSDVADVETVGAIRPLQQEGGYLLDGHYRVAAANDLGIPRLPVVPMLGMLSRQWAWHCAVSRRAFRH